MVDLNRIFTDSTPSPDGVEPNMYELGVPSDGLLMNAVLLTPAGKGPHPLVVLLHGYPGNERNLFVGETLRMIGCSVLFFHYRGAWGSPGKFSLVHVLQDACAAVDYFKRDDVAKQYGIDRARIFVVGQSMGGFATILTLAARDDLRGAVAIAPYDFAAAYEFAMGSPEGMAQLRAMSENPCPQLAYVRPGIMQDELAEHAKEWLFVRQAGKLSGKQLCVIGFNQDEASVPALHFEPLAAAYKGNNFTLLRMDGDHSYCGKKMAVSRAVCEWVAARV
ncbi:MAG TPA: alpha/beta fold hydrolase [Terriglobales bacterium]|nr:alpha/beta fold hydrolase [Terriglobales bacterium]